MLARLSPLAVVPSALFFGALANGALATMTSAYYLDRGYHSHLRLWGSEGWIEYAEHLGKAVESPLRWYRNSNPDAGVQTFASPDLPRGYTPWVRSCLRACTGEAPAPVTGREAHEVLKVIHGFYEAAESGRMIRVGT